MLGLNLDNSLEQGAPGMLTIADTPRPPYYAAIFTSLRTEVDSGYDAMAARMLELAAEQPGFLGVESARQALGITVSYWESLEAIQNWKRHAEHQLAQKLGREKWYVSFRVRIARVERDYGDG
jgi:heme-degrading monooxygenase HmoA